MFLHVDNHIKDIEDTVEFDFQEIQFDYYFLNTTNMNVSVAELRMRDDIDTFLFGRLQIDDEENMEILESLCGSSWYR